MRAWNVVITSYNYARYLPGAIESVLESDVPADDLWVTLVDDCSTDNTGQVIESYVKSDSRCVAVLRDENGGPGAARNSGIDAVPSRYVLCLDADDKIGSRYLHDAQRLLDGDVADVVYPDRYVFGVGSQFAPSLDHVDLPTLLQVNTVVVSAPVRREMVLEAGGFDADIENGYEDWDLWLRLLKAGARFEYLPGLHFFVRIHQNSHSDRTHRSIEKWDAAIDEMRARHPDLAPPETLIRWRPQEGVPA